MIAVVVLLSFFVLLMAFRSMLVPIKAAAMNLISVAASYGVVTAVFQLGWGSSLIGLDHPIPIVSFVPLLMFAILFGLSMDYEVFLMTQMKEHYVEYGDERRAVVEGLANTGRVITSAAGIMVCVFASFVLSGDPVVKEFGVGLAVAIAIDSTVVRCLLGARGDGAARQVGLVDAEVARPDRAPHQHRGRGVLRPPRCGARRRDPRPRRAPLRQTERTVFPLNLPNALTMLRILRGARGRRRAAGGDAERRRDRGRSSSPWPP